MDFSLDGSGPGARPEAAAILKKLAAAKATAPQRTGAKSGAAQGSGAKPAQ
jgi:hypothetical protein